MENSENHKVTNIINKPSEISPNESTDCPDGACISLTSPPRNFSVAPMVTHRYAVEYKMSHTHRGLALIFSHEHFNDDSLDPRPHTHIDSENLKRVLQILGFTVKVYIDLKYNEIRRKIKAAVAMDHSKSDCLLVALLSHGENDFIYAKDTIYKLDSIWKAFSPDKCPSLAGKPKLFIVQACRGKLRDPGHMVRKVRHTETDGDSQSNYRIPCYADFLIAFCTVADHSSWADTVRGSWFIYNLCDELEANGRKLNILQLLTFVSQRVSHCESFDERHKQMSCTLSTLTRLLRFGDASA